MDKTPIMHIENTVPTQTLADWHRVVLWAVRYEDGTYGLEVERHTPDEDTAITVTLTQDQGKQFAIGLLGEESLFGFFQRLAIEQRITAGTATNADAARLLQHIKKQDRHIGKLTSALLTASIAMSEVRTTLAATVQQADHVVDEMLSLRNAEQSTD